jgi:hypothetical protein
MRCLNDCCTAQDCEARLIVAIRCVRVHEIVAIGELPFDQRGPELRLAKSTLKAKMELQ